MSSLAPKPALFLDRDGIINVDRGYVHRQEDFEWIDGAIDCIRHFHHSGWLIFIVTNQSGIARGFYTLKDLETLHSWMLKTIEAGGGKVDKIYYCPYHPEAIIPALKKDSFDRKPKPGMIIQAMSEFPVIKSQSFLIGDKSTDIEAAHNAGIAGFRFDGEACNGNLHTFAEWALAAFEDGAR